MFKMLLCMCKLFVTFLCVSFLIFAMKLLFFFAMYNVNIVWRLKPLEGCLYHISIVMLKNKSIYYHFHDSSYISIREFYFCFDSFSQFMCELFLLKFNQTYTWLLIIYYEYHLTYFPFTDWTNILLSFVTYYPIWALIKPKVTKSESFFSLFHEHKFFNKKNYNKEKIISCIFNKKFLWDFFLCKLFFQYELKHFM